ncbi:Tn7-like element transposition protein TnsE [Sporolactobacillus terrae]|uniref:TnsE C-terminal domain-containing protein n=1 Tax=Sporolactobacillus terrae TaxID=269673 RepID=A0A5K7WVB5_9BACL|nr:Tn7-like element transposition protein TnsE [Sporolactobacillus terrae]BBN97584.1 hypothetical protein St703_02890 [Sporolactobacillus terrae]
MASVILKPWPFENRVVKLHWIGNAVLTPAKKWRISVAFEDRKQVNLVQYPIGLLPMFRIGQYYQYGRPLTSQKDGTIEALLVQDLSHGHTEQALNVCRSFNYYLHGEVELIRQRIWCFQSQGIHYFIPHAELIRALFVKNKELANALLRPMGLEFLIDSCQINGKTVELAFSNALPSSILNNHFVSHFAWLYLTPVIRKSFESVQSNVYANAAQYGMPYGQTLELNVPQVMNSKWTVRGRRIKDQVLIYELLRFTGADIAFNRIGYSHDSIKQRYYVPSPKKKQKTKWEKEQDFEVNNDQKDEAREDINQPVIELDDTQIFFQNQIEIKRIPKAQQQINQGDTYITRKGAGGANAITASVDESIAGGALQPIDFKTIELADAKKFGLEDFYQMLRIFADIHQEFQISVSPVPLPLGRKFALLPSGERRICAVVRVMPRYLQPIYILEVARPDQRSLSTLLVRIKNAKNRGDEEKSIHNLLNALVLKSGSWSKDCLQHVYYAKLKHTSTDSRHWADRVFEKISFFV